MQEITVLLCTCDNYSDLWENYFYLFKKYWPDFRGKIVLNTETKSYHYDGVNIVNLKERTKSSRWSDCLYHALKYVEDEYVLLMLDDLYIKSPVNTELLQKTVDAMKNDETINAITYHTEPGIREEYAPVPQFSVRKRITPYKMNATITLFRKKFLMNILRKGESAWDFEVNASMRACLNNGKFLCASKNAKPVFDYDFSGVVCRGKFVRANIEYLEQHEGMTFTGREIMDKSKTEKKKGLPLRILKYFWGGVKSFFRPRPE